MIQDMKAHWRRLSEVRDEVVGLAKALDEKWTYEPMPTTVDGVETLKSPLLDLRDVVNQLESELTWLAGHIAAQTPKAYERTPNEHGDYVVFITPKTAPCSEIAESLGMTTAQVVGLVRKLGLKPAGKVEWELADGSLRTANSYDLEQWKQMRNHRVERHGLWSQQAACMEPPDRLVEEKDARP